MCKQELKPRLKQMPPQQWTPSQKHRKLPPTVTKYQAKWKRKVTWKGCPAKLSNICLTGIALPPETVSSPIGAPPNIRPPPKLPNVKEAISNPNLGPDLNMDIEENSPHQEGIITKTYVAPDWSYLEQPQELIELVNTSKLVQKHLQQQADIDKILNIIKRKVLKFMHLPLTIKEIQTGYLSSSFFKDIYMPHNKHARCKVEALGESFILLDSLLFKLVTTSDKEKALLAIPENCVDKIIEIYHSSLFAGHQGVFKMYLIISDKFFIPHLMHYLRSYISACHVCQLFRKDKPPSRQLAARININYRPMSRLNMNLKMMPRSRKGH